MLTVARWDRYRYLEEGVRCLRLQGGTSSDQFLRLLVLLVETIAAVTHI